MMLGEDSRVKDYWRKIGQDALDHGIKGVVLMVSDQTMHTYYPGVNTGTNTLCFLGSSLVGG